MGSEIEVLIVVAELTNDYDFIKSFVGKDDEVLILAIKEYEKYLIKNNIEIFEKHKNILVAEDGYYFSTYENEVKLFDDE
jgi:hypothetical protein